MLHDQVVKLRDAQSGAEATILAGFGFNCVEYRAPVQGRMVDVLYADMSILEQKPSWGGIPILFPFPNRIKGSRFSWKGREYVQAKGMRDDAGTAIHGFVLNRPWRVVDLSATHAVGHFQLSADAPDLVAQWPADFLLEVRYELHGTKLHSRITITNPSDAELPWGLGTHPYFRVPFGSATNGLTDILLQAPVTQAWELVECFPTGNRLPVSGPLDLREGQAVGSTVYDHVLTGTTPQNGKLLLTVTDPEAGLQVVQIADPAFREVVVFTPPHRKAVCLEPYTCVSDAVHLQQQGIDAGWQVLAPKGKWTASVDFVVGPVIC